jgi:hypothetical protein
MKMVLADLWNDLRAKRLWPVALVLLAGLVAVPVVLSNGAEEPPVRAPAASGSRNAPDPEGFKGLASVTLEETLPSDGSSLDTFDPSDPFRPSTAVLKRAREEALGTTQAGPPDNSTSDTGAVGGGGSSGSSGDSATGDTGTGDSGSGDTGTGDSSGGGGGGGGDGGGGGGDDGTTTTTQYTYVIDVTFRANGRTRKIHGMERLEMLPNEASPLLLFLGVSANAGNAVFLVDSTLDAAGEGRCEPSRSDCAFLYLGAGSEHAFTNDDGESYELRVDQIRRVKTKTTASASGKRAAKASIGRSGVRRFVPPLLADLVSVSSEALGDSDSVERHR